MPRKDPVARQAYEKSRQARKNERRRADFAANPEKYCQKSLAWRNAHLEQCREADRRRAPKRKAAKSAYMKTYYQRNRARIAVAGKQRYAAKGEAIRARNARRRALQKGAVINDLSHQQWLEIQAAQNFRCWYCHQRRKGKLTQDHITPLSQGGQHTLHNVIAACRSCNSRKWIRPPPVPVQPLLLTVAPARRKKVS